MAIEIQAQGDEAIAALNAQQAETVDEQTTETTPEETKAEPEAQPQSGEADSPAEPEDKGTEEPKEEEPAESGDSEYFFNGEPVPQIEIDEEYAAQLKEAGLDADELVKELYGKDSDFTFKPETRAKLDAAFGKFAVDAWLKGQKMQNEAVLTQNKYLQKEADEAAQARNAEVDDMIGGADVWDAMSGWATENLSDDEVDAFNAAMNQPNKYLQDLAIKDMHSKYTAASGSTEEPSTPSEPYEATSAPKSDASTSPLSKGDYLSAMQEVAKEHKYDRKAYAEAMAKLDARRQAGINSGI